MIVINKVESNFLLAKTKSAVLIYDTLRAIG